MLQLESLKVLLPVVNIGIPECPFDGNGSIQTHKEGEQSGGGCQKYCQELFTGVQLTRATVFIRCLQINNDQMEDYQTRPDH